MSSKGGQPQAPNPVTTANAQTQSNRETAITQAGLNAMNQVTPMGNLTYSQSGTWPDGTPRFTATQSLSEAGQNIFDTGLQTQQNLVNVAQEQSGRLGDLLNRDFSLGNEAVEGRLMELGMSRLSPQLEQRRESEIARLANQGITGGKVYDDALKRLEYSENDAFNQLLLGGRNQAVNEMVLERQQPLNELLALSGQSQLQQPSFTSTPQTSVGGVDVAGINQNAYNSQLNAYNAQQQGTNQMMGGLFSAGASLLPLMIPSDIRLKTDIKRIGKTDTGVPIYKFRYKHGGPVQIGYMAQDLLETNPDAVSMGPDGFYRVNYDEVA